MKINLTEFIMIAKDVMEQVDKHGVTLQHYDQVLIDIYRDKFNRLTLDIKGEII